MLTNDIYLKARARKQNSDRLRRAVSSGKIAKLEFLIKNEAVGPMITERHLECACQSGQLEMVKYLINSPNIPKKLNIQAMNCSAFKQAFLAEQLEIIHYFLYELNYQLTPVHRIALEKQLSKQGLQNVLNLIEQRDERQMLEKNLSVSFQRKNEPPFKI